jgi:hypothetical protein
LAAYTPVFRFANGNASTHEKATLLDFLHYLPRYDTDLNDIVSATKSLQHNERDLYNLNLEEALCSTGPWTELENVDQLAHASAQDRTDVLVKFIQTEQRVRAKLKKEKQLKTRKK